MEGGLVLDTREIKSGETQKILIQLKANDSQLFIDVRKWYKYDNMVEWRPRPKGITLEKSKWNEVIVKINELMSK